MANDCIPLYETADVSAITTGAVTGSRFVNISATVSSGPGLSTTSEGSNIKVAHATAAGITFGVSRQDAASGAHVGVIGTPGRIVPVTAGGAITAGAQVEVGTAGKAVTIASGVARGQAINTVAADGDTVYVKLY